MGVRQSGCWVVSKTLILQGFSTLTIWKNQRKSVVDTKLIPLLSRHRIMPKSLKAHKFVFLRTNLWAFFTVILCILRSGHEVGGNRKHFQKNCDTGWNFPLWNSESVKELKNLLLNLEVQDMAECLFIKAEEVVKMLGVSQSEAYRIIKRLNEEMAEKGYITVKWMLSVKQQRRLLTMIWFMIEEHSGRENSLPLFNFVKNLKWSIK